MPLPILLHPTPAPLFSACANWRAHPEMAMKQDADILGPRDSAEKNLPGEPLNLQKFFMNEKFLFF